MNFSCALIMLDKGYKLKRDCWSDKYIMVIGREVVKTEHMMPDTTYTLDAADLQAKDWEVVDD